MSSLNFFVNCIILILGCQGILAGTISDVSELPKTDAQNRKQDVAPTMNMPCMQDVLSEGAARNVILHGAICTCSFGKRLAPVRDDYQHTPGIGSHKVHKRSARWNEARKICNEEGGHLAIINSMAEARILMDLFNRSGPTSGAQPTDQAFLGVHDLYTEGDWVTILDESLAKTGYTVWTDRWGGQPDNGGGVQNCGVLLREGGLDDFSCNGVLPFFCEIPEIRFL